MKIVADNVIPWLDKLFSPYAEIVKFKGREIDTKLLSDADLLLVRSTVKVNHDLLKDSSLKMVASATVGCDHVDEKALAQLNVNFAHAPGCNGNAVAEYVIAALGWHDKQRRISLESKPTAAIIGCGRIGRVVKSKLECLGLNVMVNDPPLRLSAQNTNTDWTFVDLPTALKADVICMHAPLTHDGDFPSFHLLNQSALSNINPNALLINAGRGDVIDNQALSKYMTANPDLNVVLDVWSNEPSIDLELLSKVNLGTPHIAGHSWRGKVMGSVMVYQAAREYFGWEQCEVDKTEFTVSLPECQIHRHSTLYDVIKNCYDIEADSRQLKKLTMGKSHHEAASVFDQLRKNYYRRAEFSDLQCNVENQNIIDQLQMLGFQVT